MIIAFDIGGSFIKYGILNDERIFVIKSMMKTEAHLGGLNIIEKLITVINEQKNIYPITGVAISSAGVIEPYLGIVLAATDAIPNYVGLQIKKIIEEQTGLFTTVENDVNCAALAECRLSDHQIDNLIVLTVGTGIGGAIIYQRKIYHGHAFSAGEWGKMYISGKPFEKLASMRSLMESAFASGLKAKNGEELFKLYDQGNMIAHSVIQRFYHFLSLGVANLIFTLNPKVVVIGGGISNRKEKFIEEFTEVLRLHLPAYYFEHVEIKLPKFLNDSGMLGAYIHHQDILLHNN